MLDLSLHDFVDWEVKPVFPLKEKYAYRVVLKYLDGTERVQQKGGYKTEREANTARDNTIGELYAGSYVVYSNVKVGEFLEYWLEKDIRYRVGSSGTYDTYKNIVYHHIIPFLGTRRIKMIKRSDIQMLYNDRTDYSVSVARLVKTVVNISMKYAVVKKLIPENPAEGINLPKKVKKETYHTRSIDDQKALSVDQIMILLEASRGTPIHMQILFNVLMGLRRCEINGVKYSDIDYINRTLHLQRQLGKKLNTKKEDFAPKTYTKQEVRLKTSSSYRTLPIPDYVFEAILEQRETYEKNRKRRSKTFQDMGYICCSSYGRPRSKDFHWQYYKQLLKENGLPDIRWHDLRSTFCTLLLKNEFSPKAVAKLMGHAKEIITVDTYGDNKLLIADCVDEMQPFIEDVLPKTEEAFDTSGEEFDIDVSQYFDRSTRLKIV